MFLPGQYGTDIHFDGNDILPSLEMQSTDVIVLEAIVRRLKSDHGSLWLDTDYGYNISNLIHSPQSSVASTFIENECMKDERVANAICLISSNSNSEIQIAIRIELNNGGTYNLVFSLANTDIDIAYQKLF